MSSKEHWDSVYRARGSEQVSWYRPHLDRSLAFLRRWTRKEACLKALGTGLHVEPSTFAVGGSGGARQVCVPTISGPRDVQVIDVEVAPGWVGALARVVSSH